MAATISGIFINSANGEPVNGATAKLWQASAFASAPAKDDTLPGSGQVGVAVTTGPTHGADGAYRFANIDVGSYYISVEYNGNIGYEAVHVGREVAAGPTEDITVNSLTTPTLSGSTGTIDTLTVTSGTMTWVSSSTVLGTTVSGTTVLSPAAHFSGEPWYDVKAYGAVADGSTNDAPAIQAAINAASGSNGGIVFFPAGTYKVGSALTIGIRNISLIGAGKQATVLLSPTNGTSCIQTTATPTSTLRGFVVRDMTIKNGASSDSTNYLIQITCVGEDIELSNLLIHGQGGTDGSGVDIGGVELLDSWMATIDNVHFEQLSSTSPALSLRSRHGDGTNGHPMNSIRVNNCTWQHCILGARLGLASETNAGAMHSISFYSPRFKRSTLGSSFGIYADPFANNIYGVNIIGGFFEDIAFPVLMKGYNWHVDGALVEHATTAFSFSDGGGHVVDNVTFTGGAGNEVDVGFYFASALDRPCRIGPFQNSGTISTALIDNDAGLLGEPHALVPLTGASHIINAHIGASNRTVYMPVDVQQSCRVNAVTIVVGTQSGNISVGIYNENGSRLATSGAVSCPASGRQEVALTGTVTVQPGRYYVALSADNTTATFGQNVNTGLTSVGLAQFEGQHPCPATATFGGRTNNHLSIIGNVVGSPF